MGLRPDPVDLAVAMSDDLPEEELRALVADRHRVLAAQLQFFRHEHERSWAGQTAADALILQHAIVRLEAETRWHEDLLDTIPKLCGTGTGTGAGAGAGAERGTGQARP